MATIRETRLVRQVDAVLGKIGDRQVPGKPLFVVPRLQVISRKLAKLGDRQYSEYNTIAASWLDRKMSGLLAEAMPLAASLGATCYHQTGAGIAALFLIFPGDVPADRDVKDCYTNGVAIY